MKKLFISNNALIMTAVVLVLYGFSHGFIVKDFIWFARSGSLVVAIGILLLSRTFLSGEDLLLFIGDEETLENKNHPEYYKKRQLEIPEYIKNDQDSRKSIGIYGPVISAVGTIIWGYGDLLNNLISQ